MAHTGAPKLGDTLEVLLQKFLAALGGTPYLGSSAEQTLTNLVTIVEAAAVVNGSVALTSGVAATILSATVGASQMAGGQLFYTVEVYGLTEFICSSGTLNFSVINKAGVYTSSTSVIGAESSAKTHGTDTMVNTFAFAASSGNLQITSTVTGITPVTFRVTFSVKSNSQQAVS